MTDENLVITFDRWWVKLKNKNVGDLFTTLRTSNTEKFTYYWNNVGKIFDIVVTNTKDGFKGFKNRTYLLLLFEVLKVDSTHGVTKALLLDVNDRDFANLSKELIEYDTRE